MSGEEFRAIPPSVQHAVFNGIGRPNWRDHALRSKHLSEHLASHLATMARLHAANRYDRFTEDVEEITGRPATSVRDFVASHAGTYR
jgi:hypothetical protein